MDMYAYAVLRKSALKFTKGSKRENSISYYFLLFWFNQNSISVLKTLLSCLSEKTLWKVDSKGLYINQGGNQVQFWGRKRSASLILRPVKENSHPNAFITASQLNFWPLSFEKSRSDRKCLHSEYREMPTYVLLQFGLSGCNIMLCRLSNC